MKLETSLSCVSPWRGSCTALGVARFTVAVWRLERNVALRCSTTEGLHARYHHNHPARFMLKDYVRRRSATLLFLTPDALAATLHPCYSFTRRVKLRNAPRLFINQAIRVVCHSQSPTVCFYLLR
ncbi:uncharacterized [Tachysurus ichikawai]